MASRTASVETRATGSRKPSRRRLSSSSRASSASASPYPPRYTNRTAVCRATGKPSTVAISQGRAAVDGPSQTRRMSVCPGGPACASPARSRGSGSGRSGGPAGPVRPQLIDQRRVGDGSAPGDVARGELGRPFTEASSRWPQAGLRHERRGPGFAGRRYRGPRCARSSPSRACQAGTFSLAAPSSLSAWSSRCSDRSSGSAGQPPCRQVDEVGGRHRRVVAVPLQQVRRRLGFVGLIPPIRSAARTHSHQISGSAAGQHGHRPVQLGPGRGRAA